MVFTKPDDAAWFAVEHEHEGGWERVTFSGGRVWFPADTVDPADVIAKLAPGQLVRVQWAQRDRRKLLAASLELVTGEDSQPTSPAAPPQVSPQPSAAPPGATWPVQGQAFPAPHGAATTDPLTQLFYVTSMVEKQQARQQELLIHFITAGMEREALRTQQVVAMLQTTRDRDVAQMQQHYQALDAVRADRDTKIEQLRSEAQTPIAELADKIEELTERIEEDGPAAAIELTEDSSDAERFVATIGTLVERIASSPLGQPIGEAIARAVQARAGGAAA